ncbi:hypothetical protein CWI75_12075 [Kineobactrum sediminis]|uniref:Uncharacterized protein n=2 Tax=Kineobactrum sediminis TaxID=1905677 RepID=A0A2N5Y265_9GAMM|nr:hypothetical protein CWI75_12075 [Kineobactrum sediminis]
MYGALAVAAATSGMALAQSPAAAESALQLAMNDAPVTTTWRKLQVRMNDSVPTRVIEVQLSDAALELTEKLDAQLEARLARELDVSI